MIGTSVGNYQIESLIGEGGMGRVYLAIHPGIGRKAAIKVLAASELTDPSAASRFVTEARAANAIRHPSIVDVYDSGLLKNGAPYIVMEYLEGESLARVLARGPVPLDDALDWACQIAEALAAAHQGNVVHRDLKPDNLFLIPDPRRREKKRVKVLDFGIAKLESRTLAQISNTRPGALLGTPLYMSPEQCTNAKEVDFRTDIYSLGAILYELFTGRRLFDGDTVYAIIHAHVNEVPVPLRTLRPELPPEVEAIVLQAVAKAPSDRQESMTTLLANLEVVRGHARANPAAGLDEHHPSPESSSAPPASSDIRTIGDTAVALPVPPRTVPAPRHTRLWLPMIFAASMALAVFYRWGKPSRPNAVEPSHTVSSVSAPIPASAPVAPPTSPAPKTTASETVTVDLASTPVGAAVFVEERLVGTTPTRYTTASSREPIDFVFRLPGLPPERIRALPTAGLTVRATFAEAGEAGGGGNDKRLPATKHRQKPAATIPPTDIQTER